MGLKRANVVETKPAAKGKTEMPLKTISGTTIKQYNDAAAALKASKAIVDAIRPDVLDVGLTFLFEHNLSGKPVSSVKMSDETGESLRLSFQDRYSVVDAEQAVHALETELSVTDVNKYLVETTKATFDSKVFLTKEGDFNEPVYKAFSEAIAKVAAGLGISNPLGTVKVVIPKSTFNDVRWNDFKSVAAQKRLAEVLPNTVSLTPIKSDEQPTLAS
jgi:hypothetical protein